MKNVLSILCLSLLILGLASCSKDDAVKPQEKEEEVKKSNLAKLESFEIDFGISEGVTYDFGDDIKVSVPFGTDITKRVTTYKISAKATIDPESGTKIDYEDGKPKVFTITAENGDKATYNVIVNIRGEVGSGSKLKTYKIEDDFRANFTTTYTYSSESGFVTKYLEKKDDFGSITDINYEVVYDAKNQVTELKKTAKEGDKETKFSTTYTYDDEGKITKATETKDGEKNYSYDYKYDASSGNLTSYERTNHNQNDTVDFIVKYEITEGNVLKEIKGKQEFEATYDDKNNPFIGQFPQAYSAINISIDLANKNNPITRTSADDGVAYEYNDDNYPISSSYTYFSGAAKVKKTYTYEE